MDYHWTKNFSDSERANEFRSQLTKPHFLTDDIDGRLRLVAIGLSLGACTHPEKCPGGSGGTSGQRSWQRGPRL